jgi:hypothetical protein
MPVVEEQLDIRNEYGVEKEKTILKADNNIHLRQKHVICDEV